MIGFGGMVKERIQNSKRTGIELESELWKMTKFVSPLPRISDEVSQLVNKCRSTSRIEIKYQSVWRRMAEKAVAG